MRRAVLFLLLTLQPILAQADFTSDLNEAESAFAAGEYEDALMNYALLVKQPNGNSLLIKQAETSYFAALKNFLFHLIVRCCAMGHDPFADGKHAQSHDPADEYEGNACPQGRCARSAHRKQFLVARQPHGHERCA